MAVLSLILRFLLMSMQLRPVGISTKSQITARNVVTEFMGHRKQSKRPRCACSVSFAMPRNESSNMSVKIQDERFRKPRTMRWPCPPSTSIFDLVAVLPIFVFADFLNLYSQRYCYRSYTYLRHIENRIEK